jgi:hypothetical protein
VHFITPIVFKMAGGCKNTMPVGSGAFRAIFLIFFWAINEIGGGRMHLDCCWGWHLNRRSINVTWEHQVGMIVIGGGGTRRTCQMPNAMDERVGGNSVDKWTRLKACSRRAQQQQRCRCNGGSDVDAMAAAM